MKELFHKVDKMCKTKPAKTLPSADKTNMPLTERFSLHFKEKIESIVRELQTPARGMSHIQFRSCNTTFDTFEQYSFRQVIKLIADSPTSSCKLDPIPTGLLK